MSPRCMVCARVGTHDDPLTPAGNLLPGSYVCSGCRDRVSRQVAGAPKHPPCYLCDGPAIMPAANPSKPFEAFIRDTRDPVLCGGCRLELDVTVVAKSAG